MLAPGITSRLSRLRPAASAWSFTPCAKATASSRDCCAVNTTSAVAAASFCPSADDPACTITGWPCTGRPDCSGPRTL
jgi:hypothetical protein